MISSFAASLHVEPPAILGRRLAPFSAYHLLTLEAFDNPFQHITDPDNLDRLPDLADTIEAWLICSDRYSDDKRTYRRFCRSWLFRFVTYCRLLLTPWCAVADALRDYIRSYSFSARVASTKNAKHTHIPVSYHMTAVMIDRGMPFAEAMDMPLCSLLAAKLAIGELNGLDIIESQIHEALEYLQHPDQPGRSIVSEIAAGPNPEPPRNPPLS